MKILAIIPARGGSKGIIKKNIRIVNGEPLIAYSIKAAKESVLLTNYIVTTDSNEIINIAKEYGCKTHKRSLINSQDTSSIIAVIEEVLESVDEFFDLIILLQPTAPIRTGKDIDNVINLFIEDKTIESVVSVIKLNDIHPARMYNIDDNLNMVSLDLKNEKKRRQDLSQIYLRNGCIYAVTTKYFKKAGELISKNKKAYIMPESKWVNIDTERDLIIAESLIKLWKENKL